MANDELDRTEIEAVLETRRELGADYDAALVQSFAKRIEKEVRRRVSDEVSGRHYADRSQESAGKRQLALGIVSVVAGIPITIPLGITDNLLAVAMGWTGIVGVNLAHALQARRRS